MTAEQAKALRAIAGVIVGAVAEADSVIGAPGGHIYAALMAHGVSLNQYQQIMAGLVRAGLLRQSGECYHVTEQGRKFAA
jgi:hypothetical protein